MPRNNLTTNLALFDATVIPPTERQAAARMIAEDVQRRLRESNERSSAEWRNISNRAEWERFRTAKLAALRESLGQPATPPPVRQHVTGALSGDGYRIENVVFQAGQSLDYGQPLPTGQATAVDAGSSHLSRAPYAQGHGELQDMGVTWARASCFVLVMDHLGHGERRQHSFRSAADYARPFQVSRQDYYFRYDAGVQLHLVGESLIGWIASDLMRGVDLLLAQENIDPKRIILLGAVAGGGDPAAVAAALDERIAAAVPFNFGGPQPETSYPLPEDSETWFTTPAAEVGNQRATCGGRRLTFPAGAIVGGIAPRRLVWPRIQLGPRARSGLEAVANDLRVLSIADLAFTHGRGELRGQPPGSDSLHAHRSAAPSTDPCSLQRMVRHRRGGRIERPPSS